jgi:hypothetical protein
MINAAKVRLVLVAATLFHLILLGYLTTIKFRHNIETLSVAGFAVFDIIRFTEIEAYFLVVFSFGILVFPVIIEQSGFLDDYPNEPPDPDLEGGYTRKDADEAVDRLFGYLKTHTLSTGVKLSVMGAAILCILAVFLRNASTYNNAWQQYLTNELEFLHFPLLVLALALLTVGLALIGRHITRKRASRQVLSNTNKK